MITKSTIQFRAAPSITLSIGWGGVPLCLPDDLPTPTSTNLMLWLLLLL